MKYYIYNLKTETNQYNESIYDFPNEKVVSKYQEKSYASSWWKRITKYCFFIYIIAVTVFLITAAVSSKFREIGLICLLILVFSTFLIYIYGILIPQFDTIVIKPIVVTEQTKTKVSGYEVDENDANYKKLFTISEQKNKFPNILIVDTLKEDEEEFIVQYMDHTTPVHTYLYIHKGE